MTRWCVNIPCYITKEVPERCLSADKIVTVVVDAESMAEALTSLEELLGVPHPTPRNTKTNER